MAQKSSRTLLVTLLGAFARRTDDWMPISGIVGLLETLGVDESSVRTGVSRLKKREWLEAEKRGDRNGYRLTPLAKQYLLAGDRVIWHSRQPAALSEGWCIASFSVPEKVRAKRHLLRSRLAALGFGNVGTGVWIAPARMSVEASEVIQSLNLSEYTNIFVGHHYCGQDLVSMVNSSWDMAGIDASYRTFVSAHIDDLTRLSTEHGDDVPPREAFILFMSALDDWRVLPMRDPGLPRELLKPNWAGDTAAELMERVVEKLDRPAFDFVRSTIDA